MRKQDKVIIWPAYFDSTNTRTDGRRVPKNLAVPSPKILEIKDAADRLHLEYEIVMDVAYPRTPWIKTGMILAKRNEAKERTIMKIAMQLVKIRSTAMPK